MVSLEQAVSRLRSSRQSQTTLRRNRDALRSVYVSCDYSRSLWEAYKAPGLNITIGAPRVRDGSRMMSPATEVDVLPQPTRGSPLRSRWPGGWIPTNMKAYEQPSTEKRFTHSSRSLRTGAPNTSVESVRAHVPWVTQSA